MKAVLMLGDGRIFPGEALGCAGERVGEVIINTAVVGYQEMMTDPANAGKILGLTYPLIGNYGCAPKFNESNNVWLGGLVIRESSRIFSNWQAKESFADFLKRHNLLVISGVDTRTLAVSLRQKGESLGIISTKSFDPKDLINKIEVFRKNKKESFLPRVSVKNPVHLAGKKAKKRIALLDLGAANSIVRQIAMLGVSVDRLPYNTLPKDVMRMKPDGLIISNGPENDPALKEVTDNIKELIGKVPILGISTGHQVLVLALGACLTKLKLGHRGVNYPIQNPASYKGDITVQNHSWAADSASLSRVKNVKITAYNLNDRTVEEMESKKYKILGVQYIPVCPGFDEVNPVFKKFMQILKRS